ncbi:MAG: FeoA family protein [Eubacteriales bacterium]|nr:FeoA family protein [Eubacteriales bacterium]
MKDIIKLPDLPVGGRGIICKMPDIGVINRRLRDFGFAENAEVEKVSVSPFGDPSAYLVKNTVIAVRKAEVSEILVRRLNCCIKNINKENKMVKFC